MTVESRAEPESEEIAFGPAVSAEPSDLQASAEAKVPLSEFTAASWKEQPLEPAAESALPETPRDGVRTATDAIQTFPADRKPAEKPAAPPNQRAEQEIARPDAAAPDPRAFTRNDSGERHNAQWNNREQRGQSPQSGLADSHPSYDSEIFVPPGLAVADRQVAAHVDPVTLLPSERSGFSSARDDGRRSVNEMADDIKAGAPAPVAALGGSLHGVERDGPAKLQPANAFSAAIERVAAEISTRVSENRREVVIQLEPPELGGLKIDLALEGDRLQARIAVEVAETGALIQKHLPEIGRASCRERV